MIGQWQYCDVPHSTHQEEEACCKQCPQCGRRVSGNLDAHIADTHTKPSSTLPLEQQVLLTE
jgi:hypothetical protein